MSEANPNRRRQSKRNHLIRGPRSRRKATTNKILPRSSSEPILWTVQIISDGVKSEEREEKPPVIIIPTFYSCSNVFAPSPTQPIDYVEDNKKVVMSVTVEGSVGPVKALVRLGANVEEAISTVLERYKMEGRSPRLDPVDTSSNFQLHHSLFSLQRLNKRDKIGEVGGRSFYLRKSSDLINNSNYYVKDENFKTKTGQVLGFLVHNLKTSIINPAQYFISFIIKKYNKIKRRSIRLWRVLTCNDRN